MFLNADVMEEVNVKMSSGYENFDENGNPLMLRQLKHPYGFVKAESTDGIPSITIWCRSTLKTSSLTRASTPTRRPRTTYFLSFTLMTFYSLKYSDGLTKSWWGVIQLTYIRDVLLVLERERWPSTKIDIRSLRVKWLLPRETSTFWSFQK